MELNTVIKLTSVKITGVEFHASIDAGNLEQSLVLGVSAMMKLGDGDIFLAGQYSKCKTSSPNFDSHHILMLE